MYYDVKIDNEDIETRKYTCDPLDIVIQEFSKILTKLAFHACFMKRGLNASAKLEQRHQQQKTSALPISAVTVHAGRHGSKQSIFSHVKGQVYLIQLGVPSGSMVK